jgi:hypothetical protein
MRSRLLNVRNILYFNLIWIGEIQIIRRQWYFYSPPLTQKLLKQSYLALRLKSSLQNLHGRHHELLYLCIISISQVTINYFSIFRSVYYFRYNRQYFVYGLFVSPYADAAGILLLVKGKLINGIGKVK